MALIPSRGPQTVQKKTKRDPTRLVVERFGNFADFATLKTWAIMAYLKHGDLICQLKRVVTGLVVKERSLG